MDKNMNNDDDNDQLDEALLRLMVGHSEMYEGILSVWGDLEDLLFLEILVEVCKNREEKGLYGDIQSMCCYEALVLGMVLLACYDLRWKFNTWNT